MVGYLPPFQSNLLSFDSFLLLRPGVFLHWSPFFHPFPACSHLDQQCRHRVLRECVIEWVSVLRPQLRRRRCVIFQNLKLTAGGAPVTAWVYRACRNTGYTTDLRNWVVVLGTRIILPERCGDASVFKSGNIENSHCRDLADSSSSRWNWRVYVYGSSRLLSPTPW